MYDDPSLRMTTDISLGLVVSSCRQQSFDHLEAALVLAPVLDLALVLGQHESISASNAVLSYRDAAERSSRGRDGVQS